MNKSFTKKLISIFAFLLIFFPSICLNKIYYTPPIRQTQEWIAPAEANKMKNPFAGDTTYFKEAKIVYSTYCASCHGEKGKGDGPASRSINTKPADHSSGKIQKQSDGALYWKLTQGRPEMNMISYQLVLSDNQRWQLVNYIRTLSQK